MAKKMRVFLLHNVIAPYRLPVFEEIAKIADIDVYFCITKTADRHWSTSLDGYKFKHKVLPNFLIGPFFLNPTLLWHLLTNTYDIYLVGDFPEAVSSTFIAIMVAKLRRKPVVLWSETQDNNVIYYQNLAVSTKNRHRIVLQIMSLIIKFYRKMLHSSATTYAALSGSARNFLLEQGVREQVIYSGPQIIPISQLAIASTLKADSPYAGEKVLLYLGYFNALKGIDDLIVAMAQIPDTNVRLIIAGVGPEEQALKKLASGDKRITFIGYTTGVAKANLMTWADLLILPTLADCWGLVVNESLHYGTPVLTTTAAGSEELIKDGVNGIRVAPRNPGALASALNLILNDSRLLVKLTGGALAQSSDITDAKVGAKPIIKAIIAAGASK